MPRRRHPRPDTAPPTESTPTDATPPTETTPTDTTTQTRTSRQTDPHRTCLSPRVRGRRARPLASALAAALALGAFLGTTQALPARATLPVEGGAAASSGAVAGAPLVVAGANPLAPARIYADPISLASAVGKVTSGTTQQAAANIASVPQARWIAPTDGAAQISDYLRGAAAAGRTPLLAFYGMPDRDCGGYSAGGTQTPAQHTAWVSSIRTLIAGRRVIVILEPDALPAGGCTDGSAALATRLRTLASAVDVLTRDATTAVYIDAGHEDWLTPAQAASRLRDAHVAKTRGFSLNVSNFYTTRNEVAYGQQISSLLGGKHFVVDTSRNGAGPTATFLWCNPSGRLAGSKPHAVTGTPGLDGYLWIKHPGESDGTCNGGPPSGQWFASWANDFAIRSRAAGKL